MGSSVGCGLSSGEELKKPYPFQEADLETLADNDWTGIVPIEPGGGKSPLSVFATVRSGAKVTLVVAPKNTLKNAWIKSYREFAGIEARIIGNGLKAERDALADFELGFPGVYLCSTQFMTRADISEWWGDLCIVDEVHNVSKAGSKGQRKLSQYKFGDPTPLSKRFTHRLALSGTPFRNSFERAWAIMRFLWPDLNAREQIAYYDYYMWCKARMTSEEVVTGFEWVTYPIEEARVKWIGGVKHWGKVTKATKWLRESEPGRLLSEAPCVIRHFRREHCCEFHPNGFLPLDEPTVTERVVELLPAQKKAIRELEDHYMTWLDSKPLVTELTITQRQRIRQVCLGVPTLTIGVNDEGDDITTVTFDTDCPSPFYEELTNILEELGDEPVAVYLESQKFARVITERLNKDGYSAFEYSGQTTKDREENLTKFGTEYRVLVGVISAVGVGTDGIQNVCNNEVWIEQSVDETMNTQTQARTDRLGAKKQVQRFVILDDLGYAAGAMNARLAKALELRKSLVSK